MRSRTEALKQYFSPKESGNASKLPPEYAHIGRMVWAATLIPHESHDVHTILFQQDFDSPENKLVRRKAAARIFADQFTIHTIRQQALYEALDPETHLKVLQLLGELTPHTTAKEVEVIKFMNSEYHPRFQEYLQSLRKYQSLTSEFMEKDTPYKGDYDTQLGMFLRKNADISQRYLTRLFEEIGLKINVRFT